MRRVIPFATVLISAVMAADLPVREVVLYKSGVGWFERSGEIAPGENIRLNFKAQEMNDVLKSLALGDSAGNGIAGIRYDSAQPMEVRLAGFPFHIDAGQPLTALLDQFKGARVELKTGPETAAGLIVSAREIAGGEKQSTRDELVVMLDSGDMRVFDLAGVTSLQFADRKLQALLREYLTTTSQGRSKELKSVYIDGTSTRARNLSATYMIPTPTWKSSYRLLFGKDGTATLQGWAIIDNTTDDDWNNIRLAVVSGRPVSFISALYEPKYIARVSADVGGSEAQAPVVYEGGIRAMTGAIANEPPPAGPERAGSYAGLAGKPKLVMSPSLLADRAFRSIQVATEGHEMGDLFEYRFASPVTIQRNQSALIPFVEEKINARKLLVYSETYGQNPMSAAEITNSAGKTLDGGPITVFDGASYAGEALIEPLKVNDKRLISYAVDLGTRVSTAEDGAWNLIREMHVRRGVMTTRTAERTRRTYTVRNVDQKPKTLLIEHPLRSEYKLIDVKAVETTASAYRFELRLKPGATETLPIVEERVYDSSTAVSSVAPDVVLSWTRNQALSVEGRRQLQAVMDAQKRVSDLNDRIAALARQSAEAVREEERIRQNIHALNSVTGQQQQVQTYARQLAAEEARIAGLRDQTAAVDKEKETEMAKLKEVIERLEF